MERVQPRPLRDGPFPPPKVAAPITTQNWIAE